MKQILLPIKLLIVAIIFCSLNTLAQSSSYPFNDGTADDKVGDNDGLMNGPTPTQDRFGNDNYALSFDGTNDYIDFGDSTEFRMGREDFSFSLWLKYDASQVGTIINKRANQTQDFSLYGLYIMNDYQFGGSSKKMWFFSRSNPKRDRAILVSNDLSGQWHHIVVVHGYSDSVSVYVDGQFIASNKTSTSGQYDVSGFPLNIGRTSALNQNFFKGQLDDLNIYRRKLTASEIDSLYNAPNPADPIVRLSFENADLKSTGTHTLSYSDTAGTVGYSTTGTQNVAKFNKGFGFTINSTDTMVMKSIAFYYKPFDVINTSSTPSTLMRYTQPGAVQAAIGFGNGSSISRNESILMSDVVGSQFKYTNVNLHTIDTSWHFLAMVYREDSGRYIIYEDGFELATVSPSIGNTRLFANDWFFFSKNLATPTSTMNGFMDEFLIYDRELSKTELDSMNARLSLYSNIVGIEEPIESTSLNLYPNPASSQLYIEGISTYGIYSTTGELLLNGENLTEGIIDISTLKSGLYLITTNLGKKTFIKK